jgi:hypothetical protein
MLDIRGIFAGFTSAATPLFCLYRTKVNFICQFDSNGVPITFKEKKMPRQSDASQQEVFHVSFTLPRDVYQQFRLISAKTTVGMRELYKRACEEYAAKQQQIAK